MEADQIDSTFSTLLFYYSNPAFLQDDSKSSDFFNPWQAICIYYFKVIILWLLGLVTGYTIRAAPQGVPATNAANGDSARY